MTTTSDFRVDGDFNSTTWTVTPTSNRARAIMQGIRSLEVRKSELSSFAADMRLNYNLIVG